MTTTIRRQCMTALLLSLLASAHSQEMRAFNQNASRSNHTRLSFSFSPTYSVPVKSSNDSLLFRGNGAGFRFGADYFFGKAGFGFSSGFSSSAADDATINNFLKRSSIPLDLLIVTKAKQQNMYLLAGPSFRTGNAVELYAHAKGGVFINNGGLVNIQQKGAQRAAYRNESSNKSIYPGFLTGLGAQYKTRSDVWSFGVGMDYMSTKTEVSNYDIRRGGGIEALKLSRNITDMVASVTIRYSISSPRDHASGQSTGKRSRDVSSGMATGKRDAASGRPTGRRLYQPGKPVYGNRTMSENAGEGCGPVTQKVTNPDGTTEEMTFSCPADAEQYLKTKTTVGKQTQGATFGEKVNAGLHAAGGALAQGASLGIISGTVSWTSAGDATGIISNRTISGGTRSGSTTLNSQSSSTRTTNQSSFGTMVRLSARDASSGIATGKRSRDASSGMATGRRQYSPVFMENTEDVCDPCLAAVKMSSVGSNPLYKGNKKEVIGNKIDENCDGIVDVDVSLIDANSDAVVATTKTGACGSFFFANVPEGNYVVRLNAELATKKTYDVTVQSKTDLLGDVEQGSESIQLVINTGNSDMQQKAGISTSRSNIRTKSISIVEADLDGDGEYESLRANATFTDGSSGDITADTRRGTASGGIVLKDDALKMRRRVEVLKSNKTGDPNAKRISSVAASYINNKLKATATYSDGSTQDVTESVSSNSNQDNVRQYTITLADTDDDGIADAVVNPAGPAEVSINTTRSNIKRTKMINITPADVDGDGTTDLAAMPTEFAVLRERQKSYFETGDVPTSQQRPGAPIKGVIVKGGRNPSPDLRTMQTNENGEFEMTGLEAGNYSITIEQKLILEDETPVWVAGNETPETNTAKEYVPKGDVKATASQNTQSLRAQNNNTVRSNRSELKSILVEADLDGDGDYETDVTTKVTDEFTLDENGKIDAPQMKAGVSTSRSNIRTRAGLKSLGNDLYTCTGTAIINNKEVPVQMVLKTKHDTVKNSINNVR